MPQFQVGDAVSLKEEFYNHNNEHKGMRVEEILWMHTGSYVVVCKCYGWMNSISKEESEAGARYYHMGFLPEMLKLVSSCSFERGKRTRAKEQRAELAQQRAELIARNRE